MKTYLTRFVKSECANYDKHYGGCLFRTVKGTPSDNLLEEEISKCPCLVLIGRQCGYFEKSVLGPVDYKFRLPNYDYQKLFAEYSEVTGKVFETVSGRQCECGKNLKPRQRFCSTCTKKRRKATYRKMNRKRAG